MPETFEGRIKQQLTSRGMFEPQADAVLAVLKDRHPEMSGRWGDPITDYPGALYGVIWLSAREEAVKWIDANLPKAWYRPLFTH